MNILSLSRLSRSSKLSRAISWRNPWISIAAHDRISQIRSGYSRSLKQQTLAIIGLAGLTQYYSYTKNPSFSTVVTALPCVFTSMLTYSLGNWISSEQKPRLSLIRWERTRLLSYKALVPVSFFIILLTWFISSAVISTNKIISTAGLISALHMTLHQLESFLFWIPQYLYRLRIFQSLGLILASIILATTNESEDF